MKSGLEETCRELDLLLEKCLVMWMETSEIERQASITVSRSQEVYLENVSRIVCAKSALQATIDNLEFIQTGDADLLQHTERSALTSEAIETPVIVSVTCNCGQPVHTVPVEEASMACCSSERQSAGRGTLRDWNRHSGARGQGAGRGETCACNSPESEVDSAFARRGETVCETVETVDAGTVVAQHISASSGKREVEPADDDNRVGSSGLQKSGAITTGEPNDGSTTKSRRAGARRPVPKGAAGEAANRR